MITLLFTMSTELIIGLAVAGLLILLLLLSMPTYNKLVRERELVRNAMGQIAAQIESRWDLVSNLIQAAKQYAEHEASVLGDIAAKRSALSKQSGVDAVQQDDDAFGQAVSRILAVAEQYPELKADGVYKHTMTEIKSSEEHVRYARMVYNDCITKYNRLVLTFPSALCAFIFRFKKGEYFTHQTAKAEMPRW